MRKIALIVGFALVVTAIEIVTLLASLGGVALLVYGLAARGPAMAGTQTTPRSTQPRPRTRRDLVYGTGGVIVAAALVTGLAVSGGPMLAAFGLALLLPMIAGCVYLCLRYLRASP